jgi:uncharacterized protein (DUF302 family)
MGEYGFSKTVDLSFNQAIERVTEELKKEGFGVLTRIDMHEKFKEKLGIDFKKYAILGACNPPFAHKVVQEDENMGLMLPCNVVVYEKGEKTAVAIIKPTAAMQVVDNDALRDIAQQVEEKLQNVFSAC